MKHFCILISILLLTTASTFVKGQSTLTFYKDIAENGVNIGTTLHDGEDYSTDIPDIQLNIFNASSASDASSSTSTGSFAYFQKNFTNTSDNYINQLTPSSGIVDDGDYNYPNFLVIKSNDDREFRFQGITVGDYVNGEREIKIESFRNNTLIGAVTLQMPDGIWEKTFGSTNFPTAKFGNVDEIRISRGTDDGFTGNLAGFNNFVFNSAISLEVSTTMLSIAPADNSTTTFDIISNTDWTATSDQTWLTLSDASGNGDKMMTLTVSANSASSTRSAIVTVKADGLADKTVTVTQDAGTITVINQTEISDCIIRSINKAVYISNIEKNTPITIYSISGAIIKNLKAENQSISIPISAGIYIIKAGNYTKKIVIQ